MYKCVEARITDSVFDEVSFGEVVEHLFVVTLVILLHI